MNELKEFVKEHINWLSKVSSTDRVSHGMNCAYINILNKIEELEKLQNSSKVLKTKTD